MKDVDTVVFDKTGTLTHGKPELLQIQTLKGDQESALTIAHALELASEHPLANAINSAAQQRNLHAPAREDFSSSPGRGIAATIDGQSYRLGSAHWMTELGLDSSSVATDPSLSYAGKIYLADEKEIIAVFYVADTIKEEAKAMVQALKIKGIRSYMMSGDNPETAKAIADLCGIEDVMANVLPADKAGKVAELQKQGRVVAMIGDGINDAPALKQADIGIAMGMGTDIAIEAADITLLRGDLKLVPLALRLSVETFKKIRQNLFWAFFYNLIAIPLAAFGVLHPVIAEIAMAISSITVVSNANLLKTKF